MCSGSSRDITLGQDATLYVQRRDGTLNDLKSIIGEYKLTEERVPAGDTIVYMLRPKLPYRAQDDCKEHPVESPSAEQIAAYLSSCFGWIKGFVMMSDTEHLRVDMPFRPTKPTP